VRGKKEKGKKEKKEEEIVKTGLLSFELDSALPSQRRGERKGGEGPRLNPTKKKGKGGGKRSILPFWGVPS